MDIIWSLRDFLLPVDWSGLKYAQNFMHVDTNSNLSGNNNLKIILFKLNTRIQI